MLDRPPGPPRARDMAVRSSDDRRIDAYRPERAADGDGELPPSGERRLRIATLRVPSADSAIHMELRELGRHRWGRARWVGRRLFDAKSAEIVVVSLWDDDDEMDREVSAGQAELSGPLRSAVAGMSTELYGCRAFGTWTRERPACLLRIFRGGVVEGDPAAFDEATARSYLALFEENESCVSIAAGIREGGIILATLWTSWEAVASATRGDLSQVLPVHLPGWAVTGSAIHYELVTAEFDGQ